MSGLVEMQCSVTALCLLFKMTQLFHKINIKLLYEMHIPVTILKLQIQQVTYPVSENLFNRA